MNATYWAPRLTVHVDESRDHVLGRADAPVTLVEYGDYQCPYCGAAYPIVKEVIREMGDNLRFAFRHFPISTAHPHAEIAAEAAESAGAQGKFWPMHDRLFTNQQRLSFPDLVSHATAISLDVPRFEQEVGSHAHHQRVREDFLGGVRSGVNGTPTFFINGVRHDGSWDFDTLMAAVMQAAAPALRR